MPVFIVLVYWGGHDGDSVVSVWQSEQRAIDAAEAICVDSSYSHAVGVRIEKWNSETGEQAQETSYSENIMG